MKSLESSMTPMAGGLRRDPERRCREAQGAGRAGRGFDGDDTGGDVPQNGSFSGENDEGSRRMKFWRYAIC